MKHDTKLRSFDHDDWLCFMGTEDEQGEPLIAYPIDDAVIIIDDTGFNVGVEIDKYWFRLEVPKAVAIVLANHLLRSPDERVSFEYLTSLGIDELMN